MSSCLALGVAAVAYQKVRSIVPRSALWRRGGAVVLSFVVWSGPARGQSAPAGVALGTVAPVVTPLAPSKSSPRQTEPLSLRKCEQLAASLYPKVAEARAKLRRVRQELREAHYAPFMDFRGRAGVSLPPSRRGTQIYSLDDNQVLGNNNRLSWTTSVSGVVPLWTFGKISNLWDAAEAQVGYNGHEVVKVENEVILAVREAYYGWQFAREAHQLVSEAIEQLQGFETTLKEQVDEGDADEADLFRLQLQLADLVARKSEATSQREIARLSLAFLISVDPTFLRITDEPLQVVSGPLHSLAHYQAQARSGRPELRMAEFGLKARRAQLGQAKAALYPDIGVGLSADWSYAPGITQQRNPFIANLGNGRGLAAAVGLQWKMDFLPQLARIEQAQARVAEVQATARFAKGGVGVEVAKAYRQARHAKRQLAVFSEAAKLAHRWLVSTQQGIAIGVYEDDELTAPAKEYALKRFAEMNAIHDYNLATARLALAVGDRNIGRPHSPATPRPRAGAQKTSHHSVSKKPATRSE